jgi:hypothetical protein
LVLKFCIWACSDSDKSKHRICDQEAKLIESQAAFTAGSFCRMQDPPKNPTIAKRGGMPNKTGITFAIRLIGLTTVTKSTG